MQRQQKSKNSRGSLIIVMMVTAILGASAGLIYMDTVYGEGRIKAWFMNYAQKKPASSQASPEQTPVADNQKTREDLKSEKAESEVILSKDSIPIESDGATYFSLFGKKIFICTKDGVQFLNSIGDQKWSDTFTMAAPYIVREGNYVAVGDMSGRAISVYNDTGKQYSVQAEGPLVWFALNKNGYLSVISNNTSHYAVMIYDQAGRQIKGRIEESPGVYPLSVDVSDDNSVFTVSYLDITDVTPQAKLLFFYVGEVDQSEYTDSMFAADGEPDQIIPIISFIKNDICVAVSDQKIDGFNKAGEKQWEISLTNRIEQVDLGNSNYVIVALGESLSGQDGVEPGTVLWINSDGKTAATFQAGGSVNYLKSSQDIVVIGSHNHFYGVKNNGKVMWEMPGKGDVMDILMLENSTKALYVTTKSAQIIDMLQKSGVQEAQPIFTKLQSSSEEDSNEKDTQRKEDTSDDNTSKDDETSENNANTGSSENGE